MKYSVQLSFEDLLLLCNVLEFKGQAVSKSIKECKELLTSDLSSDDMFLDMIDRKCQLATDIYALQDRLSCVIRKGGEADGSNREVKS